MILTPFICRRCISRLSKSSPAFLKPRSSQLHTRVVPIPDTPLSQLLRLKPGRGQETQQEWGETQPFEAPETEHWSSLDDILDDQSGSLWKFNPQDRPDVERLAGLPLATTIEALEKKIFQSLGHFRYMHPDLMYLYGLTHEEARHAVGQLEKLLRGRSQQQQAMHMNAYHAWKVAFAGVLQSIDQLQAPAEEEKGGKGKGKEKGSTTSKWPSLQKQDPTMLVTAWQRLDEDARLHAWPQMILSLLATNPGSLLAFIRATFDPSRCPSYVVEDTFYFLFRLADTLQERDKRQREVAELALGVISSCPPRYLGLGQMLLPKIASYMSLSDLVEFYRRLKYIEHPLHPNTELHFASRLAKSSAHKTHAAQILCSLAEIPEFDMNSPATASVCTSLLTLDEDAPFPEDDAAPDNLFKLLLDRGFRPNLLGLSALMRNFCVRGHLDTAWTIFEIILEHGFEPDDHVFSIMLNGAKRHQHFPTVQRMIHIIKTRNAWSAFLVNDCLDFIFQEYESQPEQRRRQRKKVTSSWRPMLHCYAKFYDLAPLQHLTFFPLENALVPKILRYSTPVTRLIDALIPQPDALLMHPDSDTLIIMIAAHMRSIAGPKYLRVYHRYFMELINNKDPIAVKLVKNHGTLIYDIFVRAFMQFANTIPYALAIVERMLVRATQEAKEFGKNTDCPPPSVFTWTILLNGFKNHKDTRGSMKVIEMMTKKGGIEPNLVTWNALIKAFARRGDAQGAVRAMQCLEEAGFQPNDRTIQAFQTLPADTRNYAVSLLEASRQRSTDPDHPGVSWSAAEALIRWSARASLLDKYTKRPAWQPALRPSQPSGLSLTACFEKIAKSQETWAQIAEEELGGPIKLSAVVAAGEVQPT
ncbi:hypothetical protein F4775DRAFT_539968 [Biscogniauxia sp. FL1348]|nr:hypothetical protein F4775DRAFT_539968 [Biscogniauxia sp. FL1348]